MKYFFNSVFFNSLNSSDIINLTAVIVAVILTIAAVAKAVTTGDIIAIGTSITIIIIGLLAANQARKNQKVSRFSSSALYDIQR